MTAYATTMPDPTSITGRRIGAWIIDLLIYLILLFVVLVPIGGLEVRTYENAPSSFCDRWQTTHSGYCQNNNGSAVTAEGGGGTGVFWLGHLVVYIVIQGLAGGSLGKLAVGLRVVDEQGNQAGLGKSAIRTILWIGDAITLGLPIVGGVLILSTKGHRRLGDMAAGTYVVPKDQMGRPPMGGGGPTGYPAGAGAPGSGGWGQAPSPNALGGWPQPGPTGPPTPGGTTWSPPGGAGPAGPTGPAAPAPSGDGPTWDEARNAYIQYDRDQGAWVQWSDANQSWGPIDQ